MQFSGAMPQLLDALGWLFSFWMVTDAIRRRSGVLWILLILIFPPWGGLVYLLALKLSDSKQASRYLGSARPNGPGASEMPTAGGSTAQSGEPALDVADQLEAQQRYGEAALIYRKTLDRGQPEPRALHGLARCLVELGKGDEALECFATLMELNPRYRDYGAALEYAEALHRSQRSEDAIGLLGGLVEETGRINHRLALAHYLQSEGQLDRARETLQAALEQFDASTEKSRIESSHWHRRVLDMLEDISHQTH